MLVRFAGVVSCQVYEVVGNSATSTRTTESAVNSMRVPHCAICLERLRVGEMVGLAPVNQKACIHVYHKECISEWLVQHNECTLCKEDCFVDSHGITGFPPLHC